MPEPDDPAFLLDLRFGSIKRGIVAELVSAYPRSVPRATLIDRLYSGVRDGGPVDAAKVIHVTISHLRKDLKQHGWSIPRNGGGMWSPAEYKLVRVE